MIGHSDNYYSAYIVGVKDVLTYGFKCQDNTKYDHEIMDFWILSL